ncbi:MAG: hypothetical protein NT094_01570, partial [Candidatus Staskawiczbacteria bacterium]|nr:hypothetical protein [Candidatus Staskawiczbacteria bacterium]
MKNKFGFYSLLTSTVLLFLFFGMPYLLISLSLTGKIASLVTNIRYCLFCLLFASGFYWAIKSFV